MSENAEMSKFLNPKIPLCTTYTIFNNLTFLFICLLSLDVNMFVITIIGTVKRVLFAGVNFRDIEITANSRFLIFAVDRIIK